MGDIIQSLDQICAKYGQEIAKEVSEVLRKNKNDKINTKDAENLITKALGVLQEQGLYSFVLFCEFRGEKEKLGADKIKEISQRLFKERGLELIGNGDLLDELRRDDGLLTKLDDLMLAIQVLEKSLIYARFHLKAMKGSQGEE